MNAITRSASISFDPSALADWTADFYALDRLTAEHLDVHTPGAFAHSRRVSRIAAVTAKQLRLPRELVTKVCRAGAFHDVGKVDVPIEIINKPGPLSTEEFEVVKRHAAVGPRMLAASGDEELAAMVLHHHERYDGGGCRSSRPSRGREAGAFCSRYSGVRGAFGLRRVALRG